MKKNRSDRIYIILSILLCIFVPAIIWYGQYNHASGAEASERAYLKFPDFNPNAELGTKENPFIILEIVPYRGMGQFGYIIGGQEPVDPSISTYTNNLYGVFDGFAKGAFEVVHEKRDKLDATDIHNGGWKWIKSELFHQEGYFEKVSSKTGLYDKVIEDNNIIFRKNDKAAGDYNWIEAVNTENVPTDETADIVWMTDYTLDVSCWENEGNWLFQNTEIFKRNILHLPEDKIDSYQVRVVTITPDELIKNVNQFSKYYDLSSNGINQKISSRANSNGEIDLIGNADFISISPKAQAGNKEIIDLWELYGKDKSGISNQSSRYNANFGSNDLDWQTTMELFMKVGVIEDSTPIVYDISCFDTPAGDTRANVQGLISDARGTGYVNNIYKLCLMLRQRDPLELYNLYFNTNGGEIAAAVTQVIVNGRTTGSYNTQIQSDAKIYWNNYTFLPPLPDGKYPAYITIGNPNYQKYLVDMNMILGWNDIHDAVIRNTYSYNGTSSVVQYLLNYQNGIKEVNATNTTCQYSKEFFDYLTDKKGARPTQATPCEAIEYILNKAPKEINTKKSITILDLEPCNDFTLTIQDIRRMIPTYSGIIRIEQQTTPEFIGKIEDLNNTYDLIYIGTNIGKLNTTTVNGKKVTIYNDPKMDGLIYTHVGDRIIGYDNFNGVLKDGFGNVTKAISSINFRLNDSNYNINNIYKGYSNLYTRSIWNGNKSDFDYIMEVADFYRYSGNDITSIKKQDLLEYVEGGFPILLENELYTCNKDILDDSSHLYDFLYKSNGKKELINKKDLTTYTEHYMVSQKSLTQLLARERLSVELLESPIEFDVDNKNTLIENRTLHYRFQIHPPTDSNSDDIYRWNIYVDANADGRFVDKEIVLSDTARAGEMITRTKKLSEKYTGVIPWKLEVKSIKNTFNRTEEGGYAAFKVPYTSELEKEMTTIYVLQVTSNNSTLNLQELINPPHGRTSLFYKYTQELDDFNVNITTINVSAFENKYKGTGNAYNANEHEKTDKLFFMKDGEKHSYDMLIFGFGDSYSDISNANGALNNVKTFIDSGRSVMFTHDTTSFVNLPWSGNNYMNKSLANWGYGFNQYIRNKVGLDRFGVMKESGDTTPYDTATMPSKASQQSTNIYKNSMKTYPETQGLTYGNLLIFGNPDNNPWQTIYDANKGFPPFSKGTVIEKGIKMDPYVTSYVTKVNEGQITTYPYDIPDNFTIKQTHTQYYQINMDDPEIVVWFCLSDNQNGNGVYSVSPNDVRNNYYIYSKNNIMYTGVGHSSMDSLVNNNAINYSNANEVKLFINTMIAAYSAGVTAPEVAITNEEAIQNSSKEYILYEDTDSLDNIAENYRRIKFVADDRNLLSSRQIARIYYYDDAGELKLVNPVVRETNGTAAAEYNETGEEKGYYVNNGKEYYFDFPLELFAEKGTDKFHISVTNEEKLKGSTKGILLGRSLFDLY